MPTATQSQRLTSPECEALPNENELQPFLLPPATKRSLRLVDGIVIGNESRPSAKSVVEIYDELDELQSVCRTRVDALENARGALIAIAQSVAENIAGAGLIGQCLPYGYRVLENENSLYLVKDKSPHSNHEQSEHGTTSPANEISGAQVFTGQEDFYARLNLNAEALGICDLAMFYKDLQAGFLQQVTALILDSLGEIDSDLVRSQHQSKTRQNAASPAPESKKPVQRLQLKDLGRSRKSIRI